MHGDHYSIVSNICHFNIFWNFLVSSDNVCNSRLVYYKWFYMFQYIAQTVIRKLIAWIYMFVIRYWSVSKLIVTHFKLIRGSTTTKEPGYWHNWLDGIINIGYCQHLRSCRSFSFYPILIFVAINRWWKKSKQHLNYACYKWNYFFIFLNIAMNKFLSTIIICR